MKWLFLLHRMRTLNSRERVKVWRLIKKIGAVLYRNSVYVLPYGKERLEDFQWLCQQINDSKGEASVFVTESDNLKENQIIRRLFEQNRSEEYKKVLAAAKNLIRRSRMAKKGGHLSEIVLKKLDKEGKQLQDSFEAIRQIDFFSNPLEKKAKLEMESLFRKLFEASPQGGTEIPIKRYSKNAFHGKVWATREHIHIDRVCSAWLIRRFIDPKAGFVFAPEAKLPANAVPFDVFGVEFSHHGEDCTFETLLKAFQLKDKALKAIAEITHDADLKDRKFGRPEAEGLNLTVRAMSNRLQDDEKMLEIGFVLLDSLYAHFSNPKQKRK